ncbi:MAG TPA: type II CAAX endopeptidase family protein [Gaiellaceae bacterium]|nr:type II CAAX endopeptidase family protein [Gaiellaceae bacterium]
MSGRLAAWLALIAVQILLGYASRVSSGKTDRNAVYHWSTSIEAVVYYGIFLAIVLAICRDDWRELLALRPPRSWMRGAGIAAGVIAVVVTLELTLDPFLHAGREQGLTPTRWEPSHAAAFAASFVALTLIGPFVEEATFRGLGQSLLQQYSPWLAVLGTAVLFGLAHGLVESLPILVALGVGLAYLRARADSLYPGFAVHGLFNAIALILAVTT